MKKNVLMLSLLISLMFIISCKESDVAANDCTGLDYKVVLVTADRVLGILPFGGIERSFTLEIRTVDNEPFTENLTVILGSVSTINIAEGASSPQILDYSIEPGYRPPNVKIISDGCPEEEAVEKDEDDIAADTNEASCDSGIVTIEVIVCIDEYTFNWEAGSGQNLTGYVFEIYGKEIDLAEGTTVSFLVSELDLNEGVGELVFNENSCTFTNLSTTVCTGTTGNTYTY